MDIPDTALAEFLAERTVHAGVDHGDGSTGHGGMGQFFFQFLQLADGAFHRHDGKVYCVFNARLIQIITQAIKMRYKQFYSVLKVFSLVWFK